VSDYLLRIVDLIVRVILCHYLPRGVEEANNSETWSHIMHDNAPRDSIVNRSAALTVREH
jgi:hypothetical protein